MEASEAAVSNNQADRLFGVLHDEFGYDFRNYAVASRNRRLRVFINNEHLESPAQAQELIQRDPAACTRLLQTLTINVTEFFRDPEVYERIRKVVLPRLATYPQIRIWVAGCASGEEVYSLAIVLREEGLLDRTSIYATDIDEPILEVARGGVYSADIIKKATRNYQKSGGIEDFSDYYVADRSGCLISSGLREKVTFGLHSLATDESLGEFHLIMCRNVLIYFDRSLHDRARRLFHDSLANFGVLIIGTRDNLFAGGDRLFETVDRLSGIYKAQPKDLADTRARRGEGT